MKIIITESQYTILDWYTYHEDYFEELFDHLVNGIFIKNFIWTKNVDLVCNKIIDKMVERFEYKKMRPILDEEKDLLKNIYCDRIIKKFLSIKK